MCDKNEHNYIVAHVTEKELYTKDGMDYTYYKKATLVCSKCGDTIEKRVGVNKSWGRK